MLLVLMACSFPDERAKPAFDDDTGATDSGSYEDLPGGGGAYACVEASREEVEDPTVAAGEMTFTPMELSDAWAGPWVGAFEFVSGESSAAGFTVVPGGAFELVTQELRTTDGEVGEPSEDCPSYYAWTLEAGLSDATGAFDEQFGATVTAASLDAPQLTAAIPLESVLGTARPAAWDPADWASTTLSISATGGAGQWTVQVLWQASSEAAAADGTADSGTVSPSGMTEGVGSMVAVPAVD